MNWLRRMLGAWLLAMSPLLWAQEQIYTIEQFAFAAGGGESSGGEFVVRGSIEPIAGSRAQGGAFSVDTGFWNIEVTTEAGPVTLSIVRSGSNLIVSWAARANFEVQICEDLNNPLNWSKLDVMPASVDGQDSITLPLDASRRFLRVKVSN